jgi:prepilin-type N-terminal cleavage/methylation domain-containing protein
MKQLTTKNLPAGLHFFKSSGSNLGFTLIELLVVIAIIGMLSAVILVSLSSARQKARDARRISDVRQIISAAELFFNDCNQYPASLATSANNGCTGVTLGSFLPTIPTNPSPGGATYTYTSASPYSAYTLTFSLERANGTLASGAHTATQNGIQ